MSQKWPLVLKALCQLLSLCPSIEFWSLAYGGVSQVLHHKTLFSYVILKFIIRHLATSFSTHGSCLKQLLVWWLPVGDFLSFSLLLLHLLAGICTLRRNFPFSLMCLFIFFKFQYWLLHYSFIQWVLICCWWYLFWCSSFPGFPSGIPFRWTPAFFRHVRVVLQALPYSNTAKWSRFSYCFSCPYSWVSHLSKEP